MREAEGRGASSLWRLVGIFAAVVVVAVGACGRRVDESAQNTKLDVGSYTNVDRSDDEPTIGGYLRYGLPAETNSYNPGLAQWGAHSMQVARALYDPLFEYDDAGNVHPFLLESAEHNADYTEWTLTVRDNVTFHNGRKVTSTDVQRAAIQLITSPVVGTAWAINDLKGAAEIIDERTMKVRSFKPWVTLPHQSASQLGFVPDPDWSESPRWDHPVGSGPFMMDHWDVGNELVLKRNPNYWRTDRWGNRLPYLDRITFEIVPDDADRFELMRNGELDVLMQTAPGPAAAQLIAAARAGDIQLVTDDRNETAEDFVLLNTLRPELADVEVRRGLAAAVDREAASQQLTQGVNPPADGMYEPSSPWHADTSHPRYDPIQARTLLSRAEERAGKRLTFTLKGPDTPEGLRMMNFVRDEWAKVGIDVKLEAVKLSKMLITMLQGDFDALLLQHFDYPNPAPEMVFLNPAQVKPIGQFTLSLSRVTDRGITEAIDGVLHSIDPAAQKKAITQVQQRLGEIVPYIWLVHARRHIAARPRVVNLVHHTLPDGARGMDFLLGSHRLDQVWLRTDR